MHGNIEIGSKMFLLRIVLVLMTLAISPPVFAGEDMGGDMSNTILAKGDILNRIVFQPKDYKKARKVEFVYAVKYKGRIYHCIVSRGGTSCTGTPKG
jgi:phage terminase large subunit-like protein